MADGAGSSSALGAALPLAGLRVIDAGTRIGAPFCAGLLGEQGAEVIKVERPDGGDFLRQLGPFDDGYSLWWAVEGRGRASVTCDLRSPAGQDLFRRLAATADVMVENFRPGTMEEWGLGPADLPDSLVYVRISGFGQDGPYAQRPALDRMGIAHGGLLYVTGDPDGPPMRPGVTLADYLTGVFAAEAAVAALYAREVGLAAAAQHAREVGRAAAAQHDRDAHGTGRGRVVDAPLHASVLRIMEWTIAAQDRLGLVRERTGNRVRDAAPMDNYRSADGRWVSIVAGSDANFQRLCVAMERTDLLEDARLTTTAGRGEHADETNDIVADWVAGLAGVVVVDRCLAAGVPVAVAQSAADIVTDEHVVARGDLVMVEDPVVGPMLQQAPHPRFDGTVPPTPTGAPLLGQHNEEIWKGLVGLTDAEFTEATEAGVI
ncbi:MAG TPA: CoA transferase [Nitriliruptorales bacterium]